MRWLGVGAVVMTAMVSCGEKSEAPVTRAPTVEERLAEIRSLENLHVASDGVIMGGEPKTEQSFADLEALGVKTIVSVDGIAPNLEEAGAHGIRYVHVPIGYDTIEEIQRAQLTRALAEAERPIYVHCHHGKHRGPTAAVVGLVGCGELSNDEAVRLMEVAGTSQKYKGLWATAREMGPMTLEEARAIGGELVERAEVNSLAGGMAVLDRAWLNLDELREARWDSSAHPDVVPANEAAVIAEAFRGMVGSEDALKKDELFGKKLAYSYEVAQALEAVVTRDVFDSAAVEEALDRLDGTCMDCHALYRN